MAEIVVIEKLTKKYSDFFALNELSLKINAGVCIGYLGPNGAGKTTTIRLLTGLLRPTSGRVFVDGVETTQNLRKVLTNVGVLVENPQFIPNLTPKENLSYFGKLRGIPKNLLTERVLQVLKQVNLIEWQNKQVGTFSKGMKQRLGLASTILHDPALLILDEPTSGLDPRGMIEVRQIIKQLKKLGKTIFMSSHLLSEVQEVCDEVALLDKGKLLRYDSVQNIESKRSTAKIKIETLHELSSEQIDTIKKFKNVLKITKDTKTNIIVELAGTKETKSDFLTHLQNSGIRVVSFKPAQSDLESLYMDITSESVK